MISLHEGAIYFQDLLDTLDYASKDANVIGIVTLLGASLGTLSFTEIQELRDAILRFRKAKKVTICFCDQMADAVMTYYIATSFEKIYVSPVGMVSTLGLHGVVPFAKQLLQKLEIEVWGAKREEYKTAMNLFTEDKFTDAHKEVQQKIIDDYLRMIVQDIADSRKVDTQTVMKWFDNGVLYAPKAVKENMIDGIAYRDEVYDNLVVKECKLKSLSDANLLYLERYKTMKGLPTIYSSGKHKIAIIYMYGDIVNGENPQV